MGRFLWIFVLVLGLSLSLSIAAPQGRGKGVSKGKSTTQKKTKAASQAAQGRAFGKDQEKIIRNWFSHKKNLDGLPPGLAKREQLPPGLQKNRTVPPGLQKRVQPLPRALERSLPKPSTGLKRAIIGDNLVLVDENSGEVLDIITDVFSTAGQVF